MGRKRGRTIVTATLSESARNYTEPGGDQYPQTTHPEAATGPLRIQRVGLGAITAALADGARDWLAFRTDVLVMVVLYPLAALCLTGVIVDRNLLPFVFPICAGMALVGPVATLWFAALSRQRELDGVATSESAAAIFDSPRVRTIKSLALLLIGLFALWIVAAAYIYAITLGSGQAAGGLLTRPFANPQAEGFLARVFTTPAGHEMIITGVLVGAAFALVGLAVGLVGFPLALDRQMSLGAVITTSVRVALMNPLVTLGWGCVVVAGLVIGAVPGLLGLALTIPILGHASWHLYRRLVTSV